MQKLAPQQASRFTHILYIPPQRGCRSDQGNSCKTVAGLAVPKAVSPLRTEQRLSSLAQLIAISLSPPDVVLCLSFSSILPVFSNPAVCPHIPRLVRAADEVLHTKLCARSPNPSPQTMAEPDMISPTILPICTSRAKGL